MSYLEILALIFSIAGGAVGFISTLLPIIQSRLKLKVVLPKQQAYVYYDIANNNWFDYDLNLHYDERYDFFFSADIGVLNLSNKKQVVYSIKLNFFYSDAEPMEFELERDYDFNHYTLEKQCVLPLEIEPNSAELVAVHFKICEGEKFFELMDFQNGIYEIVVYCQDKTFSLEIDNIKFYTDFI